VEKIFHKTDNNIDKGKVLPLILYLNPYFLAFPRIGLFPVSFHDEVVYNNNNTQIYLLSQCHDSEVVAVKPLLDCRDARKSKGVVMYM